ncbi:hypothetical protein, partial [Providencia rettgeri]|uniref:hypothetical protein n=1 Tax=Providencia rettgeri TaxID=587 RepID=UPI001EF5CB0C
RLLESHTYVCSSRYPRWPPTCNSNYLEYSLVVSRTAALLAAFGYSNHILMYAHRDILAGRLPAIRII